MRIELELVSDRNRHGKPIENRKPILTPLFVRPPARSFENWLADTLRSTLPAASPLGCHPPPNGAPAKQASVSANDRSRLAPHSCQRTGGRFLRLSEKGIARLADTG